MTSLHWEESPHKSPGKPHHETVSGNPWFAATMGLVGIILGYVISLLLH